MNEKETLLFSVSEPITPAHKTGGNRYHVQGLERLDIKFYELRFDCVFYWIIYLHLTTNVEKGDAKLRGYLRKDWGWGGRIGDPKLCNSIRINCITGLRH